MTKNRIEDATGFALLQSIIAGMKRDVIAEFELLAEAESRVLITQHEFEAASGTDKCHKAAQTTRRPHRAPAVGGTRDSRAELRATPSQNSNASF